ncbi:hypothetical protein [uncultured Thiodictyon sp.]|uniref:hypothetical protein n=1 Tax=uncultured Thiodictyon sp. TaxID=1846217 RepID=UPI0025D61E7B|nr:hypothetical protein [uncultured Thiodictyon sp.]
MKRALCLSLALLLSPLTSLHAEGVHKTIHFPRGQSATTVSDSVVRGDRDLYDITAKAGQTMTVKISSVENNAVFTLYQPGYRATTEDGIATINGATLDGAGEGDDAMRWQGTLPASGTYLIEVGGTRGNATYKLTVGIK